MRTDTFKVIAHIYVSGGVVLYFVEGIPWLLWIGLALVLADSWSEPFVDWVTKGDR